MPISQPTLLSADGSSGYGNEARRGGFVAVIQPTRLNRWQHEGYDILVRYADYSADTVNILCRKQLRSSDYSGDTVKSLRRKQMRRTTPF
jgi:hypothetical protein